MAAAALAGFFCSLLHIPIAWMVGAMLITAIGAFAKLPVMNPELLRPAVRALIGCMLGVSVTADVSQRLAQWAVPIAGLVVTTLVGATVGWLILRRVGKLDPITAFFGSMPGGLMEMTLLGDAKGGSPSSIALIHSVRIFTVILSMPFLMLAMTGLEAMPEVAAAARPDSLYEAESLLWLAGCAGGGMALGRLLRLPSPDLFGALILSSVTHFFGWSSFALPPELLIGAQVVLGIGVGVRFVGLTSRLFLKLALLAAAIMMSQMVITGSAAYAVSRVTGIDYVLLLLAYAPGGLNEMSMIAIALGRDAVFVAAHHLVRIMSVLVTSPPLSATLFGKSAIPPPEIEPRD